MANSIRVMIKDIRAKATVAEAISAKDLTAKVNIQSEHDELGNAFAKMTGNLNNILSRINEAKAKCCLFIPTAYSW